MDGKDKDIVNSVHHILSNNLDLTPDIDTSALSGSKSKICLLQQPISIAQMPSRNLLRTVRR